MSLAIIKERLETYQCRTEQEVQSALKEIAQEIALAALARSDFFKNAAFQGGTCLRILYSLNRFSEDLDFVSKEADPDFNWAASLKRVIEEFRAFGIEAEFQDKSRADNAVKKGFFKDNSLGKLLNVRYGDPHQKIKIKFEVDTNPPAGSTYEVKYLDFPFPFAVTTQDPPSLFAGKSHALLCREYLKGRDWYDFVWYVARMTGLNFKLLQNGLNQSGPWKGQGVMVDSLWYLNEMERKIKSVDWKEARNDVIQFIKPQELESLNLWSQEFFLDRLDKIRGYLA